MSKGSSGGGAGTAGTAAGGRTPLRPAGGIDYRKSDRAIRDGDVMVKVDVGKLDDAWKKDGGYRIPPGGGTDRGKYENAKKYAGSGKPMNAPQITYDKKTGGVSFTDGRHRYAAVRDAGKKTAYVTVPRGQAKAVARKFGAK